ncbi:hypothetical protein [Fontibacter flavus]|uniref:Lipocalin-like domain-containing protein n=1 Tax=Fontibacter flavus TaxID=654838 RepID=A0ABV6FTV0_9BACT
MQRTKAFSIVLLITFFVSACGIEDNVPETLDYSKKIIGTWQLDRSFNLVDASMNPPAYDWFEVEDGYYLSLFDNNTFIYTRFEECNSGEYQYDPVLQKIEFSFDCEFDYQGEMMAKFTEFLEQDKRQNDILNLSSPQGNKVCVENCSSIMKRIH